MYDHVCMYACMIMYACMNACMHVCMDAWMHACMYVWMDGWTAGWMDGCMRMHACMHILQNMYRYILIGYRSEPKSHPLSPCHHENYNILDKPKYHFHL